MTLTLGLVGLIPLAYATFRLGRGALLQDKVVLTTFVIGCVGSALLGLVPGLIVGGGFYLLGKGTVVEGGRGVVLVLTGSAILSFPILLVGLFYLASTST